MIYFFIHNVEYNLITCLMSKRIISQCRESCSYTTTKTHPFIHSFIHSLRFSVSLFFFPLNTYTRCIRTRAHAHVRSINRSAALSSSVWPLHHKANIIIYTAVWTHGPPKIMKRKSSSSSESAQTKSIKKSYYKYMCVVLVRTVAVNCLGQPLSSVW